ncbi:butyrate kinase [Desulfovibrio sp. OttesenSCG-928-F07]|nr:butyrate kinase [Desulfovibrio sp. OttesenSCG-928-F07]
MSHKMLVMNMGSTSTKIAVFEDETQVWREGLEHPREDISKYHDYRDQYDYRKEAILTALKNHGEDLSSFDIFVSRGGTIKPIPGGVWKINEAMLNDAWSGKYGEHPCNIGGQIAFDFGKEYSRPAVTVDPPICSELSDEAKMSGLPQIERIASGHFLNQRAIARKYAREQGKDYTKLNLIVAHMGGGVSVGAHKNGKVVEFNNALAGDGPMAMERAGGLPTGDLINMCFSGKYSREEMIRLVNGRGGMFAYLGLTDARKIEEQIEAGDERADQVTKAMAYQIAREIGSLAPVFAGKVDAILLTAGLAYWNYFVNLIRERVEFIAPVYVYPGENEMLSLAEGAFRFLSGSEEAQEYA